MNNLKIPIYFDHHSTTPLDPRVLQRMMPYLTNKFGNASSMDHQYGQESATAVEISRENIAKAIGSRHDEIIFTSGATESNNLALTGIMSKYKDRGNHMITCITEHKAILDTAHSLNNNGKNITYLSVNEFGDIDLEELQNSITNNTVLISVMAANNEIGTIANIKEIGNIAHESNILFHTDAAQIIGHMPIDVKRMNIDLMSFSAHKLYGPKGIGALYVRGIKPNVKLDSILHGGGQERNIRSGTLNVPGIVGFEEAIKIAQDSMVSENNRFEIWQDKIIKSFTDIGAKLNGGRKKRLRHNINMHFPGIESKSLVNSISKYLAISAGSACTTQYVEPSHVILALGHDAERAHSSIRIGLGRFNTEQEVDYLIDTIISKIELISSIGGN